MTTKDYNAEEVARECMEEIRQHALNDPRWHEMTTFAGREVYVASLAAEKIESALREAHARAMEAAAREVNARAQSAYVLRDKALSYGQTRSAATHEMIGNACAEVRDHLTTMATEARKPRKT